MKERPILFSAPMVRAILSGQKTMTRRVVRIPNWKDNEAERTKLLIDGIKKGFPKCPYGQTGDRLWVRETWGVHYDLDNLSPSELLEGTPWYRAAQTGGAETAVKKWRPSIHMPRWASRILLEITELRVERLQDISEEDAWNEGVEYDQGWEEEPGYGHRDYSADDDDNFAYLYARDSFMSLWESIYGPDSWEANPWVWVVCFRRIA